MYLSLPSPCSLYVHIVPPSVPIGFHTSILRKCMSCSTEVSVVSQFGMTSGNSAEMPENAVRVVPNPMDLLRDFVLLRTGAQGQCRDTALFPK